MSRKVKQNRMKNLMKLLTIVIAFSIATESYAQTKKGNILLAGGTGLQFISSNVKYVYDGETEDESNTSQFSIVPSFAYFVQDNLAIGLTSTINISTYKYDSGSKSISNSTMLIPTVIYYFPMEGKIRPIAQVGVGLSSQTEKYIPKTGNDEKESYSGLAINIGGGFSYFIKENISLNFGLSYTKVTLTDGDDDKYKIKQGNFGSNIGIAVYF